MPMGTRLRATARSSVLYGFGTPELAYVSSVVATVGKPLSPVKPTRLRRTGEPSIAISPTPPTGLNLDTKTGVLSGTPQAARQKANYTVTMTDLVGQATATLSIEAKAPASPPPPPPPPPTVKPKLTASKLAIGKAIAGKTFTVSTTVQNSTTGHTIKGQVACTGKLNGRPLRATHRSSRTNGKTSCTWQLPKTAHGKHFTGTITATYKGARIQPLLLGQSRLNLGSSQGRPMVNTAVLDSTTFCLLFQYSRLDGPATAPPGRGFIPDRFPSPKGSTFKPSGTKRGTFEPPSTP